MDPINVKIAELREALESVTAEQKYLKARDTRHRHSMLLAISCSARLISDLCLHSSRVGLMKLANWVAMHTWLVQNTEERMGVENVGTLLCWLFMLGF